MVRPPRELADLLDPDPLFQCARTMLMRANDGGVDHRVRCDPGGAASNISSYECEVELLSHPAVREAAAIPVPSEHSEETK